jgi:hypothetical protein
MAATARRNAATLNAAVERSRSLSDLNVGNEKAPVED